MDLSGPGGFSVRCSCRNSLPCMLVMGTIMLEHKIGGMLDHDLIEENL